MGYFKGNGANRQDITLGFKPSLVFVFNVNEATTNIDYTQETRFAFSEGHNVYQYGDPVNCLTMNADALFARNRGGAAVTSTGFAVGYYYPGAGYTNNLQYVNNSNFYYAYCALK